MNKTSSGAITLEKADDWYDISIKDGPLHEPMLGISACYFDNLQSLAKQLDYDETNLNRGDALRVNNVSLIRGEDRYNIYIHSFGAIEFAEEDMHDLMECLKTSSGWNH